MTNACIWGHKDSVKNTSTEHKALRYFLVVGKMCPIAGLIGETGWIPFKALIRFNILKFWHRVVTMQADTLTHQIYSWSKSLADTGITNWAEHTSNLLSSLYETTYTSKTILWMIFGMRSWSRNFRPGDHQWKLSQRILRLVAASFSTSK